MVGDRLCAQGLVSRKISFSPKCFVSSKYSLEDSLVVCASFPKLENSAARKCHIEDIAPFFVYNSTREPNGLHRKHDTEVCSPTSTCKSISVGMHEQEAFPVEV